jgi:hypothetical protein
MPKVKLNEYGLKAKSHWERHRPRMVKDLKDEDRYEEALLEAQKRTTDEIKELLMHGFQLYEAEEVVLPKYVLLPDESDQPNLAEEPEWY